MPAPVIPTLPEAPSPSDSRQAFNAKAFPFVQSLGAFGDAINAFGEYLGTDIEFVKTVRAPEDMAALPNVSGRQARYMWFDAGGNPSVKTYQDLIADVGSVASFDDDTKDAALAIVIVGSERDSSGVKGALGLSNALVSPDEIAELPDVSGRQARYMWFDASGNPQAKSYQSVLADVGGVASFNDATKNSSLAIVLAGVIRDATSVRNALNVANGATANATNAQLRDRATHTGTQAISTVAGLGAALDAKLDDSQLRPSLESPDNSSVPSTLAVASAIADSMAGESPQGAWNASTNTPALASSVGTAGYWYEVSVAGTTNLNGETGWQVGDKAIFNGIIWTRIPANAVRSVDGRTGAVILNFDTAAQAALASLPVGTKYSTKGAIAVGDGGHGSFVVKADEGETVDDFGVIQHANGTLGILRQAMGSTVNVLQFGAVGDGVTDDSAALQRAIDFGSKIVDGRGKEYAINQKVFLRSNLKLRNFDMNMQQFECGTTNREYALDAIGSWGSQLLLTADADADTGPNPYIELSAPDAATISRGDLLFISHNVFWNSDNNCYIGELVEVRQVVGTLIYLQSPLLYSYDVISGASIRKITPVEKVTLKNINVIGPANPAGILTDDPTQAGGWYSGGYVQGRWAGFFGAYFSRDIRVENCTGELFNRAGVEFRMSMRNWMEKCHFHDIPNYYGCLVADASRNTWIDKCEFTNTRHGVSTGSSNSFGGGIVSHLYIDKVTATSRDAGLDCHDETDFVSMTNCKIFCDGIEGNADGIVCQARRFVCKDIQISGNINIGIKFQPLSTYPGLYPSCTIGDIDIVKTSSKSGTTVGVQVQYGILGSLSGKGTNIKSVNVSGAFTRSISVSVEAAGVDELKGVNVNGCDLRGATAAGLYIQAAGQDISAADLTGNFIDVSSGADCLVLRADTGKTISDTDAGRNRFSNGLNGLRFLGVGTWSRIKAKDIISDNVTNRLPTAMTLQTIAAGEITITGDCDQILRVDTESAAASDDLATINGGFEGQLLTLVAANSGRDVVAKDGANLKLNGDFTLTHADDTITLKKFGSVWLQTSSSDNAA